MPSINLTNVYDDAQQIIRTRPRQLIVLLALPSPSTASVGEHVERKGELYWCVDLCRTFMAALFVLKSLKGWC